MPRGGGRGPKKNYKGKRRTFTDAEELENQKEKVEREKQWRRTKGEASDEDEEGGAAKGGGDDSDSSSDSSSEEESRKGKGVESLIEIENPNRVVKKTKKISDMNTAEGTTVLSRREREELEKQQAKQRYQQLHQEGKTDEARSDLARLALIRKQREEAAKKREEEKREKDEKTKGKKS